MATRIALAASLAMGVLGQACSFLGPGYPASVSPRLSESIQDASVAFTNLLEEAVKTGQTDYGPFDNTNTTFSIGVFSAQDPALLFEFHHQATGTTSSPAKSALNGDSVYRIGSVTKALAIYTMLVKLGSVPWQDPITKYIPELANSPAGYFVDNVQWSQVTLGALASHLGGITRDYALRDLSTDPRSPLLALGFPPLEGRDKIRCGSPGFKPCTREVSLELLLNRRPIAAAFQTPAYSNAAYGLLGLALEKITGESFEDIFDSTIVGPLNLNHTSWHLPPTHANVVIPGDKTTTWWDYDLGQDAPAGNAYQSLHDLSTVGRAILGSTLLPENTTHAWLKPASHSESLHGSLGLSWEIVRLDIPVSSSAHQTRVLDLYTKGGGIGAYGTLLALSPDHGMGFAIMAAGPAPGFPGQIPVLAELALSTWMPAAEAAARSEAGANFVGVYATPDPGNGSTPLYSATITLDPGKPGLSLTDWSANGTDILGPLGLASIQLYPVRLEDLATDGRSFRRMSFRGVMQPLQGLGQPTPKKPPQYLRPCSTAWLEVDSLRYGGIALDEFDFELQGEGKAAALEIPVLRTTPLMRLS